MTARRDLHAVATYVGQLVEKKRRSYGDSFPSKIATTLRTMFPDGVRPDQFEVFLFIARLMDKAFRLSHAPTAFGEDALRDIAGYALLMLAARTPRPARRSRRRWTR